MWWERPQPGSKLTLALPVKDAGRYDVTAQFTKSIESGIIQAYLDGEKLGDAIDLYNTPDVIVPMKLSLGTRELAAGEHKLMFEVVGANPKGAKAYQVQIDYVKLERAK